MVGDFGPSPIKVVSLLATDPTQLGARYRAGNMLSVSVFFVSTIFWGKASLCSVFASVVFGGRMLHDCLLYLTCLCAVFIVLTIGGK